MTVILKEGKGEKEDENEIDVSFNDYISKIKPPNSNREWMEYIGIMWGNAYSMGMNATLEYIKKDLENNNITTSEVK